MNLMGAHDPIGTQLLRSMPDRWPVTRMKAALRRIEDRSRTGVETLLAVSEYYGVKPRQDVIGEDEFLSRSESLEGYKRCRAGDLVINIMLAWKTALGVAACDGIVSPAYEVFRPKRGTVDPRFLGYLLRSRHYVVLFKSWSYGIVDSRLRLYPDVFLRLPLVTPHPEEQKAIAAFLDRETAKIDGLVADKERLIELLQEKRTALITRAVTRGLDPNVPMKDSGVEWLGEVPANWNVHRLKFLLQEPLHYGANEPAELMDPDLPRYIRITDVGEDGRLREETFRSIPEDIARPHLLRDGDLLFARSGATVGKTFRFDPSWGRAAHAGYLIRARLKSPRCNSRFVRYFTTSVS